MAVSCSLKQIQNPIRPLYRPNSTHTSSSSSSSSSLKNPNNSYCTTRRKALIFTSSILTSLVQFHHQEVTPSAHLAIAQQTDELDQEEDRIVQLFHVLHHCLITPFEFICFPVIKCFVEGKICFFLSYMQEASSSVVFIKDFEVAVSSKSSKGTSVADDEGGKAEGTGSGFIWDKFGHIVTNYHVVRKLVTDTTGQQRCKIFLADARGNRFAREGKVIGFDPAYDLAVLKVDVDGVELNPVTLGTSRGLHVGQSCYAIGNPYGFENTLTTGVVSGLAREIPSPNGSAIRGAIQTDAAINAGTGISSGVNFAIPVDTVVNSVPYLIVYGTPYANRF